jgi:hypothetical protein
VDVVIGDPPSPVVSNVAEERAITDSVGGATPLTSA